MYIHFFPVVNNGTPHFYLIIRVLGRGGNNKFLFLFFLFLKTRDSDVKILFGQYRPITSKYMYKNLHEHCSCPDIDRSFILSDPDEANAKAEVYSDQSLETVTLSRPICDWQRFIYLFILFIFTTTKSLH